MAESKRIILSEFILDRVIGDDKTGVKSSTSTELRAELKRTLEYIIDTPENSDITVARDPIYVTNAPSQKKYSKEEYMTAFASLNANQVRRIKALFTSKYILKDLQDRVKTNLGKLQEEAFKYIQNEYSAYSRVCKDVLEEKTGIKMDVYAVADKTINGKLKKGTPFINFDPKEDVSHTLSDKYKDSYNTYRKGYYSNSDNYKQLVSKVYPYILEKIYPAMASEYINKENIVLEGMTEENKAKLRENIDDYINDQLSKPEIEKQLQRVHFSISEDTGEIKVSFDAKSGSKKINHPIVNWKKIENDIWQELKDSNPLVRGKTDIEEIEDTVESVLSKYINSETENIELKNIIRDFENDNINAPYIREMVLSDDVKQEIANKSADQVKRSIDNIKHRRAFTTLPRETQEIILQLIRRGWDAEKLVPKGVKRDEEYTPDEDTYGSDIASIHQYIVKNAKDFRMHHCDILTNPDGYKENTEALLTMFEGEEYTDSDKVSYPTGLYNVGEVIKMYTDYAESNKAIQNLIDEATMNLEVDPNNRRNVIVNNSRIRAGHLESIALDEEYIDQFVNYRESLLSHTLKVVLDVETKNKASLLDTITKGEPEDIKTAVTKIFDKYPKSNTDALIDVLTTEKLKGSRDNFVNKLFDKKISDIPDADKAKEVKKHLYTLCQELIKKQLRLVDNNLIRLNNNINVVHSIYVKKKDAANLRGANARATFIQQYMILHKVSEDEAKKVYDGLIAKHFSPTGREETPEDEKDDEIPAGTGDTDKDKDAEKDKAEEEVKEEVEDKFRNEYFDINRLGRQDVMNYGALLLAEGYERAKERKEKWKNRKKFNKRYIPMLTKEQIDAIKVDVKKDFDIYRFRNGKGAFIKNNGDLYSDKVIESSVKSMREYMKDPEAEATDDIEKTTRKIFSDKKLDEKQLKTIKKIFGKLDKKDMDITLYIADLDKKGIFTRDELKEILEKAKEVLEPKDKPKDPEHEETHDDSHTADTGKPEEPHEEIHEEHHEETDTHTGEHSEEPHEEKPTEVKPEPKEILRVGVVDGALSVVGSLDKKDFDRVSKDDLDRVNTMIKDSISYVQSTLGDSVKDAEGFVLNDKDLSSIIFSITETHKGEDAATVQALLNEIMQKNIQGYVNNKKTDLDAEHTA